MFNYKQMRVWFVSMLFLICWQTALAVSAQGLVGAPVDPRYGQNNEIGYLADYGYDCARDISRIATGVSVLLACLFGWWRSRKVKGKRLVKELLLLALIPAAIYFGGLYAINNLGGIGGCPVACGGEIQNTLILAGCHHV